MHAGGVCGELAWAVMTAYVEELWWALAVNVGE